MAQLLPWLDQAIGGVANAGKAVVNNVEHSVGVAPTFRQAPQPPQRVQAPIQQINQATGFNQTPFRAPIAPRPPQQFVAPHINMPLETLSQFGQGVVHSAVNIVNPMSPMNSSLRQGFTRIPETVVRSIAQPGATAIDPNANTSQRGSNTGVRGFLYGKDPVQSYQDQAQALGQQYQALQAKTPLLPKVDPKYAPFIAPVLAGLDLAGGGKGGVVEDMAKAGTKEAVLKAAEKNGISLSEQAAAKLATATKSADIKSILNAESKPLSAVAGEAPKDPLDSKDIVKSPLVTDYSTNLYRGANDVNASQAHPDRAVFHAEDPTYAETYGKVSSTQAKGRVLDIQRANAFDSSGVAFKVGNHMKADPEWATLSGKQKMEAERFANNYLDGEQLSRQMTEPMPEIVKRAYQKAGIDYIRVDGSQFRGTVGGVGHQTEVIEIPKPKQADPLASLKQEAPTYRGASKAEWDAVQKTGKFGQTRQRFGKDAYFDDNVNTVGDKKYAENYAFTGGQDGVVIEYKPSASSKVRNSDVTHTADMGDVQEQYGKGLDINDVQRVTDRNGNVLYEAHHQARTEAKTLNYGNRTVEQMIADQKAAQAKLKQPSKNLMEDPAFIDRMKKIGEQNAKTQKPFGRSSNLYHTTSAENLNSIRQNGLTLGNKQRFEGVGSKDKLHFAANEKGAAYYGKPGDVMVRTKASWRPKNIDTDLLGGGEGTYRVGENVPPEALEIKVGGKWQPLVEAKTVQPRHTAGTNLDGTPMGGKFAANPKTYDPRLDEHMIGDLNPESAKSIAYHLEKVTNELNTKLPAYQEALPNAYKSKAAYRALQENVGNRISELAQDRKYLQDLLDKHPASQPFKLKQLPDVPTTPTPPKPMSITQRIIKAKDRLGNEDGFINPDAKIGKTEPKIAENKFTQSVKNSPEVSPEVRSAVSGQHEVRNTKELVGQVNEEIKTNGLAKTTNKVMGELSSKNGSVSDETLARAIEVAKAHDALGTESGANTAASLYDQVAEHATAKGQSIQILSILARRTPEGLRNKAFRDLKKAGVEITPEIKNEITSHINTIRKMADGEAKDFAIAVLQKAIAKHLPQSKIDNAVSLWKAGLLSGVKTQGGNLVSNATVAVLKKVSDLPATAADQAMSLTTGRRTKTLTMKGSGAGMVEGAKKGWSTMKTGIDQRNIGDKYEQHAEINLGNKFLQKVLGDPANLIFRGMSAADQPFYYSALKNSLYDQAKADGINLGLKGRALSKHMTELATNPTEQMVETATYEAQKSVLAFDTAASKIVSGAHKGIDNSNLPEVAKHAANATINVLAPFTKVPSAFLSRTVDFTPLGFGREVIEQIYNKKFDQRQLAQAIGEGATGTGIIALGIALAHNNMLSGQYPKNDATEAARWKAEGKIPNAVKMGDKWISLNYLGQVGLLFGAGKAMTEANSGSELASAVGSLGQGLLGQSFLQGLTGFSDALKDPARNAKSFINSLAGSVVPGIVNDVANATDSMQRQANSGLQTIQSRIPGVRENLPAKTDAFGNPLQQASGSGIETAINPLKPSQDIHNPLLNELDRLKSAGKDSTIFPTPDKSFTVGKDTIKLDEKQAYDYNNTVGQKTQDTWNQIIQTPQYASLDDVGKKQALEKAYADIKKIETIKTLQAMGDTTHADTLVGKLSSREILSGQGNYSPSDYASPTAKSTTGLSPAQKYQANLAKYNTDKAAGKLNATQDFKTQQSLAKEKISSNYPAEVIQFAGLSNAQKNAMFHQDPTTAQKLYDQAKQYNLDLVNAGLAAPTSTKQYSTKSPTAKVAKGSKATSSKTTIASLNANAMKMNKQLSSKKLVAHAPKTPKLPSMKVAKVTPPKKYRLRKGYA